MTREQMLLVKLMEECNELAHRCSKAIRFSLSEVQPEQEFTNAERIVDEYKDLYSVIVILEHERFLRNTIATPEELHNKINRIEKYFKYSQNLGILKNET